MFLIGNKQERDTYWSNAHGWVGSDTADMFALHERHALRLPLDGYWVPMWSVDLVQFQRLIAEFNAAGLLTPENLEPVAASMDLDVSQVLGLISRAESRWEETKSRLT